MPDFMDVLILKYEEFKCIKPDVKQALEKELKCFSFHEWEDSQSVAGYYFA